MATTAVQSPSTRAVSMESPGITNEDFRVRVADFLFGGRLAAVFYPADFGEVTPILAAKARPVRPASLRISRRRTPSASRACRAGPICHSL
jgi:hypothetical protein